MTSCIPIVCHTRTHGRWIIIFAMTYVFFSKLVPQSAFFVVVQNKLTQAHINWFTIFNTLQNHFGSPYCVVGSRCFRQSLQPNPNNGVVWNYTCICCCKSNFFPLCWQSKASRWKNRKTTACFKWSLNINYEWVRVTKACSPVSISRVVMPLTRATNAAYSAKISAFLTKQTSGEGRRRPLVIAPETERNT